MIKLERDLYRIYHLRILIRESCVFCGTMRDLIDMELMYLPPAEAEQILNNYRAQKNTETGYYEIPCCLGNKIVVNAQIDFDDLV